MPSNEPLSWKCAARPAGKVGQTITTITQQLGAEGAQTIDVPRTVRYLLKNLNFPVELMKSEDEVAANIKLQNVVQAIPARSRRLRVRLTRDQ